jgi:hypothetical protein
VAPQAGSHRHDPLAGQAGSAGPRSGLRWPIGLPGCSRSPGPVDRSRGPKSGQQCFESFSNLVIC